MKKNLIIIIALLLSSLVQAKRVGLVLSGGGSLGIAHVGMLQAFEDKGIPIDYITGTSIGSIVGGLYAMGYSPQEMFDLFTSEEFMMWQSGTVDSKKEEYYKKKADTPTFIDFRLNFKEDKKVKTYFLPTNVINPIQMNIQFIPLCSPATAACGGDFNKLMVPFRCVASDMYNKEAVVMDSGDLGEAIRASMSFPFMFKPIKRDSILLYDGGIFDNFPVGVMIDEFNPEYIIGSIVVSPEYKLADENDLYAQVEQMITHRTDYSLRGKEGTVIQFDLSDYQMFDFSQAPELFRIGYTKGLQRAEQILQDIDRTVSKEEVAERRRAFHSKCPNIVFQSTSVLNVTTDQAHYILSQIPDDENGCFDFKTFETAYFNMLSDKKITELFPRAEYDAQTGKYDLILDVKFNDALHLSVGGNISISSANTMYIGADYQHVNLFLFDHEMNAFLGQNYSSLLASSRAILPAKTPVYIRLSYILSSERFFETERLFYEEELQTYLRTKESFGQAKMGMRMATNSKAELSLNYGVIDDRYVQSRMSTVFSKDNYKIGSLSVRYEFNTLDDNSHPTIGHFFNGTTHFVSKEARYYADVNEPMTHEESYSWIQLRLQHKNYLPLSKAVSLGYHAELMVSNKSLLSNYTSTVIQAPAFTPTAHSQIVFNESFRGYQYLAVGIMPIVQFKMFQLRTEFYGFAPGRPFVRKPNNLIEFGDRYKTFQGMAEISAVAKLPFATLSLFANYYTTPKNNFNMGINIGIPIRNPKFLD